MTSRMFKFGVSLRNLHRWRSNPIWLFCCLVAAKSNYPAFRRIHW